MKQSCNFELYFEITVLPRLVRMRTIKLMSFSRFVLTERAYYSAAHYIT